MNSTLTPQQEELALASVKGQPYTQLPQDLYIPPDALEVILEAFEGPLDLLLYLIRKQNLDILDIPIARITEQYMAYIDLMQNLRFDLAAEYLLMAAILAEIKSRMLLPQKTAEENEDDPRAELIRRLQEYERYKNAASEIDQLPRQERDFSPACIPSDEIPRIHLPPDVDMRELFLAFKEVIARADLSIRHQVTRETLSVRENMSRILQQLSPKTFQPFNELFLPEQGRMGIVVCFLAILELLKENLLEMTQNNPMDTLYLRLKRT